MDTIHFQCSNCGNGPSNESTRQRLATSHGHTSKTCSAAFERSRRRQITNGSDNKSFVEWRAIAPSSKGKPLTEG